MNTEYMTAEVVEIGKAEDLILGKEGPGSDDNAHLPPGADEVEE